MSIFGIMVAGGFICLILCGIIWFVFTEIFWECDLADSICEIAEIGAIIFAVIFGCGLFFGLIDLAIEESMPENMANSHIEERADIIDRLSVAPFEERNIRDAIEWNSTLEKLSIDDEDGYLEGVEKIDYLNYQRKYAKDKLDMVPKNGTEIIDETVIEIKKEDFEAIKEYIDELETKLNDKNTSKKNVSKILEEYGG